MKSAKDILGYKPLPAVVDLAKSDIHGWGLLATELIRVDQCIGATHFDDFVCTDDGQRMHLFTRTPFGGFINHSETPTVERRKNGVWWAAYAVRDIEPGEEITLKYNLYNPEERTDED